MTKTITTKTNQVIKFYETTDLMELTQKAVTKAMRNGSLIQSTNLGTFDTLFFKLDDTSVGIVQNSESIEGLNTNVFFLISGDEVLKTFYEVTSGLVVADKNVIRKINKTRISRKENASTVQKIDVTSPKTITIAKDLKGFRTVPRKNIVVERIIGKPEYLITNKTNTRNRKTVSFV